MTITQSMLSNGLKLGSFALLCTFILSGLSVLTKAPIEAQVRQQLQRQLNAVLPKSLYDNDLIQSCRHIELFGQTEQLYLGTKTTEPSAVVITTTAPDGYSGKISLLIGLDRHQYVQGVRVLTHQETPGLGDKVELIKSDWILSFAQKLLNKDTQERWAVKKDGGDFDQFTGATITPRAVINQVRRTVNYYSIHQERLLQQSTSCTEQTL